LAPEFNSASSFGGCATSRLVPLPAFRSPATSASPFLDIGRRRLERAVLVRHLYPVIGVSCYGPGHSAIHSKGARLSPRRCVPALALQASGSPDSISYSAPTITRSRRRNAPRFRPARTGRGPENLRPHHPGPLSLPAPRARVGRVLYVVRKPELRATGAPARRVCRSGRVTRRPAPESKRVRRQ